MSDEKKIDARRFTFRVEWRERPGLEAGKPLTEEDVTFEVTVNWPRLARWLAIKSMRSQNRRAEIAGGSVTVRPLGERGEVEPE